MTNDEALDKALREIEKSYGKGTVGMLGDDSVYIDIETVPTGSFSLDMALGKGMPLGRLAEVFGPEGSGKTTVALHIVAEAQKKIPDKKCMFIDAEHVLDRDLAREYSVDIKNLLFSQPSYGEQTLDICEKAISSGKVSIVVVDSVAALIPKAELEGEMEDKHIGTTARIMSQGLKKLSAVCAKNQATIIFVNQVREKVGIMFGNPETTPGGRSLKFYASVRLEVRRGKPIEREVDGAKEQVGHNVNFNVVKNKLAPPFKKGSFPLIYGRGIDMAEEMINIGTALGVLEQKGAYYYYKDKKWQGREGARNGIKEEGFIEEIRSQIVNGLDGNEQEEQEQQQEEEGAEE